MIETAVSYLSQFHLLALRGQNLARFSMLVTYDIKSARYGVREWKDYVIAFSEIDAEHKKSFRKPHKNPPSPLRAILPLERKLMDGNFETLANLPLVQDMLNGNLKTIPHTFFVALDDLIISEGFGGNTERRKCDEHRLELHNSGRNFLAMLHAHRRSVSEEGQYEAKLAELTKKAAAKGAQIARIARIEQLETISPGWGDFS